MKTHFRIVEDYKGSFALQQWFWHLEVPGGLWEKTEHHFCTWYTFARENSLRDARNSLDREIEMIKAFTKVKKNSNKPLYEISI